MHACTHGECVCLPPTSHTHLSTVPALVGLTPCMFGATPTRKAEQKRASRRSTASSQRPRDARVRRTNILSYNGAQLHELELRGGIFCIRRSLDTYPRLLHRASTPHRSVLDVVVGCAGHSNPVRS